MADFNFFPRPDAYPMKWKELVPPLRRAVRDLLLMLDGSLGKRDLDYKTANSFLVYGGRGSGKSTVLLSGREAVCTCGEFFTGNGDTDRLLEETRTSAKELQQKGVIWLETLDLESLPMHTNLLTTMLTRLRNAINLPEKNCSQNERKPPETRSLMEEPAESARHKLTQLINEATLMWEEIHEQDSRSYAQRQVVSAETYTKFRQRFEVAVEMLSKELGWMKARRRDELIPIILPIDNIDRSIEHLQSIVKLSQMVASPYLWFVMAGDREDIDYFLQRIYRRELVAGGGGEGGGAEKNVGTEDDISVVARHQAIAASHKLFPPSHRIKVDLMKPEETLAFWPARIENSTDIYNLLQDITVPIFDDRRQIKLGDLFYIGEWVETKKAEEKQKGENRKTKEPKAAEQNTKEEAERQKSEEEKRRKDEEERRIKAREIIKKGDFLTPTARRALNLPVRGALDLWQVAYWAGKDNTTFTGNKKDRAENIARSMLRNVIAESRMPDEMARCLQEKIIHCEPGETTALNFHPPNPSLKVVRLRNLLFERSLQLDQGDSDNGWTVRSTLSPFETEEMQRFFLKPPVSARNSGDKRVFKKDRNQEIRDAVELPHSVAGWLVALHDVEIQAKNSWVVQTPVSEDPAYLVMVKHQLSGKTMESEVKEILWPAPEWSRFFAKDIFCRRWENLLEPFHKDEVTNCVKNGDPDEITWKLAMGWVGCVLDTFYSLSTLADTTWGKQVSPMILQRGEVQQIRKLDQEIWDAAASLYCVICSKEGFQDMESAKPNCEGDPEGIFLQSEAVMYMKEWLEQKLPLFLSYFYVPLRGDYAAARVTAIEELMHSGDAKGFLVKAWKRNARFILANLEKDLAEIFGIKVEPSEIFMKKVPPPFNDLHDLLQK